MKKNYVELKKKLGKVYYANNGVDAELTPGQEIPLGRGKLVLREEPDTSILYIQKLSKNGNVVYSRILGPDGYYYCHPRYAEYVRPLGGLRDVANVVAMVCNLPLELLIQRQDGAYSCTCFTANSGMCPDGTTTIHVVTDGQVRTVSQCSQRGGVWEDLVVENATYVIEYDKVRKRKGYEVYIRKIVTWPQCDPNALYEALEQFFE